MCGHFAWLKKRKNIQPRIHSSILYCYFPLTKLLPFKTASTIPAMNAAQFKLPKQFRHSKFKFKHFRYSRLSVLPLSFGTDMNVLTRGSFSMSKSTTDLSC